MDTTWWSKLHGASTHFPIALALCSWACDAAGFALGSRAADRARHLHAAGAWTMPPAALGGVAAVISGLVLTRGDMWGHAILRWHHLFVWPAFGLLIGAATWRLYIGPDIERRTMLGYLGLVALTALLISAAGYWGGELLEAP